MLPTSAPLPRLATTDGVVEWAKRLVEDLAGRIHDTNSTVNGLSAGGASVAEPYVVMALSGSLTNERVLAVDSGELTLADGGAGGTASLGLATSGVSAGSYGSATQVPAFSVDAFGRITSVTNTTITGVVPAAHNLLSSAHGDTVAQTVSRGSLIYGNSTPAWDELTIGAADRFLGSDGTDAAWTAPGALTRVDDTNVTLTLGGTPSTALLRAASLTLGWTGQLAITRGGTGQSTALAAFNALSPLTTRGDLLTRDATNNVRLAIGAANRFLGSDGTDAAWTAPGALTRVDDTNVTLTLGGSPTTALLRAASLTLGWTGQLAISRGGTGQSTATAAFDALAPTTTTGDLIYYNGSDNVRLAVGGANTVLGVSAGAPAWQAQSYIDHGSLGGLTDDDHTGYTRIAGRTGTTNDTILSTSASGTLYGSSNASSNLNLQSTNTTRGLVNIVDEGRIRTGLTSVSGILTNTYGMQQVFALAISGTVNTVMCLGATGTIDDQSGNVVNLFRNNATISRSTAGAGGTSSSVLLNDPTINANGISISGGSLIAVNHSPTYSVTGAVTLSGEDTGINCAGSVGASCTITTRRGVRVQEMGGSGLITTGVGVDVASLTKGGTSVALRSAIAAPTSGAVGTVASAPTAGGAGYTVGDVLTISTGGAGATVLVTGVSAGAVTSVVLTARGSGYTTGTGKATTGGTGAGCTVNITALQATYFLQDTGGAQSSLVGKFTTYNNVTTAGFGLATIVAVGRSTAQTAAVASVATLTPAAAGTFRVSANVLPTTATSHNFTVTVAYTDDGGSARTLTLNFFTVAGTTTVTNAIANAAGAVPYHGIPVHIRSGASAITVATTGTFTTVTYNVEAVIEQLA